MVGAINPKVINYYINTLFTIKCRFHSLNSKDFYGAIHVTFSFLTSKYKISRSYRLTEKQFNYLADLHAGGEDVEEEGEGSQLQNGGLEQLHSDRSVPSSFI